MKHIVKHILQQRTRQSTMSFANIDLEAQKTIKGGKITSNQTSTQNELDKIIDNTSNQLQVFGNLISQFENQRKSIGTKRDNEILRRSLDSLTVKVDDLDTAISKLLANLGSIINQKQNKFEVTNRQVIIKDRLVSEFNELHQQYVKSSKIYSDKKKIVPLKTETTPLLAKENNSQTQEHSPGQAQVQTQEQMQNQDVINETELQYHRMLTEERNREIEQAAEGVMEVNSIFKDLGALVHQQGEQLDLVEDNIANLQSNTQQASRELTKAHEYQKKKGKWSCILLVALCIFVLVIVLAIIS